MTRILTALLALVLLLVVAQPSEAALDAAASGEFGALFPEGKAGVATSVGAKIVLGKDTADHWLVYTYEPAFFASGSADVIGGGAFFGTIKYLPGKTFTPYAELALGMLYEKVDGGETPVAADIKLAFGGKILNWISLGLGVNYSPRPGQDWCNPFLGIDLSPPF